MSNLIPTPRTDKNGVTRIRHMKPQAAETSRRSPSIPPVTSARGKAHHQRLVLEAVVVLCEALTGKYPDETVRMLRDTSRAALTKLSTSTVTAAKTHPWKPDVALRFCIGLEDHWSETKLNDYMALSNAVELPDSMSVSDWHLDSYGLYPDLCPHDCNGPYPEERLSQLAALYRVTEHMADAGQNVYRAGENGEGSVFYIPDNDLRNLILHPDEKYSRDDIVNVIRDRSIFDADLIRATLDFDTKSLRGGVL